jgi:hypothetical protein
MKRLPFSLIIIALFISFGAYAQNSRELRAAEMTFKSAERDYNKSEYNKAAQKYDFVVNTIPESSDSRKHVELRLDALINLIDIYFYKSVNIQQACECLHLYQSAVNAASKSGVLRATGIMKYAKQAQELAGKHTSKCESYERVGGDKKKFEGTFDDVFKEHKKD